MATKNRRWKCPECGAGRLAPSRMAADDVRRVCFPCSEKALDAGGKALLVRMTCPALEAERNLSKQARADRGRKSRAKSAALRKERAAEKEARFILGGMDLRKELREIAKLPFLKSRGLRAGSFDRTDLSVERTRSPGYHVTSGCAQYGNFKRPGSWIQVNVSSGDIRHSVPSVACAWSTLMHEALHSVGYRHDENMVWAQIQLTKERWGLDISTDPKFKGDSHGAVPTAWMIGRLLAEHPAFIDAYEAAQGQS